MRKMDGWTDERIEMTELTFAFRNVEKEPKNYIGNLPYHKYAGVVLQQSLFESKTSDNAN